ncbi:chemotaxis response regulator protein-glutamate methylesterase [Sedimentibacter hydroxybenzoicus DSM 7310]|uniref:Protein-glutamate methylesterase/protein-glutamine glutaminase n=1 Tax=Sedimentibacter hydroxybenzoicus DSM 7310 TaxID=1123245 RepID=A0A974GV18_SEDHY|nr:chemotaxis response regulator protein-glutamate methylesterase [Sedimentibacter hydroxybenzoicus]NYB72625.1 chemotaxis response regulator protein-glutamate methylesterase [Sedimentibacter hydroxybenzoicus DSM 7310]
MIEKNIKVLIIDDSLLFRNVLKNELNQDKHIDVVGTAVDPVDAMDKIKELNPDILTLDVEMPKMDGLTFIKKLMVERPIKVVLVSSMNISVFDALHSGAVDFVKKPDMSSGNDLQMFFRELKTKIKIASIAKLVTYAKAKQEESNNEASKAAVQKETQVPLKSAKQKIIAIGASTGGTEATLKILRELPEEIPGILVTQHMPPGFTKMYADRLNKICKIEVREAVDGDRVKSGLALIAPGDKHMKLKRDSKGYYVSCSHGEKVSGHCPSVDVLFNSVAEIAGNNSVGIILTGMGKDGAQGLMNMKKTGAYTIGQDEKSCVVYGMPMVAYNIGAVQVQASIDNIADILIKHLNRL